MQVNGERIASKNVKRTLIKEKDKKRSLNVNNYNKARYLVDKFLAVKNCADAGNCYNYFVKCFSTLPENTIWDIYENAVNNPKIHSPIKYFIAACRNQMR